MAHVGLRLRPLHIVDACATLLLPFRLRVLKLGIFLLLSVYALYFTRYHFAKYYTILYFVQSIRVDFHNAFRRLCPRLCGVLHRCWRSGSPRHSHLRRKSTVLQLNMQSPNILSTDCLLRNRRPRFRLQSHRRKLPMHHGPRLHRAEHHRLRTV